MNRLLKHFELLHNSTKRLRKDTRFSSATTIDSLSSSNSYTSSLDLPNYETITSVIDQSKFYSTNDLQQASAQSSPTWNRKSIAIFALASHLKDEESEWQLLSNLSQFLIDVLYKSASLEKPKSENEINGILLKRTISSIITSLSQMLINQISNPTFINYQLVTLIKKYLINTRSYMRTLIDGSGGQAHNTMMAYLLNPAKVLQSTDYVSLNEMKLCLNNNEFEKLHDMLDRCSDLECLKHFRLYTIGEMLDVAVINYWSKQEKQSKFYVNGSNVASIDDRFPFLKKHFNFNANINSKVKRLKQKNLRRQLTHLRSVKTICERQISILGRNSAAPVTTDRNSNDESLFSFDISLESDFVKSFNEKTFLQFSPDPIRKVAKQPKRIFKFETIMCNNSLRPYLKLFLERSLFNTDLRCDRNKFRKDIQISECAVYLIEIWECIHFNLATFQQPIDVNISTIIPCFYSILVKFSDSRFYYTFSDRFLQLDNSLLKSLERFLICDIDLAAFAKHSQLFKVNELFESIDFSDTRNESNQKLFADFLCSIDAQIYLDPLIQLEKSIYNCLNEEFYPQFLISLEYDEMLRTLKPKSMEIDCPRIPNWFDDKFVAKLHESNHEKPISKVCLEDEHLIDIEKNRTFLLNSYEFSYFSLASIYRIVEFRLVLKVCIKQNTEKLAIEDRWTSGLYEEIVQILSGDIEEYRQLYAHLRQLVISGFSWMYANFQSEVIGIHMAPNLDPPDSPTKEKPKSGEKKLFAFVENIIPFNETSSTMKLDFEFRTTASLCVNRLQNLAAQLSAEQMEMICITRSWQTTRSLDDLVEYFNHHLLPIGRMLIYLSEHQVDAYFDVIRCLLERSQRSHTKNESIGKLDRFLRMHNQNLSELKRLHRLETNLRRKANKISGTKPLSFRKLLDRDQHNSLEDQGSPISTGSVTSDDSIYMSQISVVLNRFLAQLNTEPNIIKTVGFFNFISGTGGEEPVVESYVCFRCLLHRHLASFNCDDLSGYIIESLMVMLETRGQNVRMLYTSVANGEIQPNRPILSNLGSKLLLNHTNNRLDGSKNRSNQLLFLHARSLLHNMASEDILDSIVCLFKNFQTVCFCKSCSSRLQWSTHSWTKRKHSKRPHVESVERFRLFRHNSDKHDQSSATSTNLESVISSEDAVSPADQLLMDQLLTEELDDSSTDLLEPLFHLISEVFELKGSVTKNLRRTLIFAFRLLFGQTMVSKPIRTFLQSLHSDSNILRLLSSIQETICSWNSEQPLESNLELNEERVTSPDEFLNSVDMESLMASLKEQGVEVGEEEEVETQTLPQYDDDLEKARKLQILAKQLMFASVPTVLNHLFGQMNTITGLNKVFDIFQYQSLNKQLIYVSLPQRSQNLNPLLLLLVAGIHRSISLGLLSGISKTLKHTPLSLEILFRKKRFTYILYDFLQSRVVVDLFQG